MTQEHSSKLSFSIEESVWLNKGQEIEEILGMSLEPEIVIEERADHVYIRGGLRLVGEYEPAVKEEEINVERSLERQVSFRSAGEVVTNDNGKASIKHFFPIDVTIPVSRIHDLDDVYVQVESFDYDLPEKSCIQLTADISISGMTNLQDTQPQAEEPKPKVAERAIPTAFAFDAKRQPATPGSTVPEQRREQQTQPPAQKVRPVRPSVQENTLVTPSVPQPPQPVPSAAAPPKQAVEEQQEEAAAQLSRQESEKPEAEEPVALEVAAESREEEPALMRNEPEQAELAVVETGEEREEEEAAPTRTEPETKITLAAQKRVEEEPLAEEELSVEEEEEAPAESEPPTPREENALYLTKMMAKKEERFIKLKMCIIQENESLETIADRYDVSTNQLVRINRLQNEQVEEGQILYIPVSSES
ncbi:stage VI sporulation protein D [Halalkalibacter oceani]|uniref:stage VI sporulation protein D n=1 Tax=Halalkalibacter oceani TaxID=1653776 RepID=UPI0033977A22